MTVADFKAAMPEFQDAPEPLVETALQDAAELCPESVWGEFTDNGIRYTAARRLALSPYARELALVGDDGRTVYDRDLEAYKRIVAIGPRVI